MSVLLPNFQRYLESGSAPRNPPPPRVTLCRGTSTRDEVQYADAFADAVCDCEDKAVQAVVEYRDVDTLCDAPFDAGPVALPLVHDVIETAAPDLALPDALSPVSSDVSVVAPNDFTVDGLLAAQSVSEVAASASESGPEETSPVGPSLIDSEDELIATCLPGYLNSFQKLVKYRFGNIVDSLAFVVHFSFLFCILFFRFHWKL